MGGLGLFLNGDLIEHWDHYSNLTKVIITRSIEGNLSESDRSYLTSLTAAGNSRGYGGDSLANALINERGLIQAAKTFDVPNPVSKTAGELIIQLDLKGRNMKEKISAFNKAGWFELRDVQTRLARGAMFSSILSDTAPLARYSTIPWKKRFNSLYLQLGITDESKVTDCAPDTVHIKISEAARFDALTYYNVGIARRLTRVVTALDSRSVPKMLSFFELMEKGHAVLRLPNIIACPTVWYPGWIRPTPGAVTTVPTIRGVQDIDGFQHTGVAGFQFGGQPTKAPSDEG